jgi:hypothetical protein
MKKILVALILLIIFYLALNFTLNIFLPEKINKAAKEFVEENFGRKITVSQISVNILRGIFLKNITAFEADGKTPYLIIKTAHLSPFYPSFLSSRKIFLSVKLEGVYFTLKRNPDNTFNLPHTEKAIPAGSQPAKGNEQGTKNMFLVKNLSLKNLNLDFIDIPADFRKKFENVNIFADFKNYPRITSKILWQDKIVINTKYNALSNELKTSVLLKKLALSDFNNYFPQLTVREGFIKNAKINIEGKENYVIKIDTDISKLLLVKEKAEVSGDIHTNIQINITNGNAVYAISGNLSDGLLKFPPYLDNLIAVNGSFNLDNKKMQLTGFTAELSSSGAKTENAGIKIPLTADAEVNFETSQINIRAKADPKINDLLKIIKTSDTNTFKALKDFDYEGDGDINLAADIKTNLRNEYFNYYIEYNIKNAGYKEFRNIRANGFLANDKFKVEECKFTHKNLVWNGKFELNDFSSPDIKLSVNNNLFNLNLEAKQLENLMAIKNLAIKTKNSHLKAEGGYHKDSRKLELQGLAYVELSEIAPLADTYNVKMPWLKKADPQGVLNAKFMINGPLNPDKWQTKLAGLSEKLRIYNLEASEVKLEFYRDKDLLILSPLVADCARGKIELRVKIDSPNKKVVINTLINDLDLALLRKQLKLKDSSLSGILSMDANFENNGLSSFDKMEGSGKVNIHDGNIWEINFLKGMGEFLFIPEFEQIKFEEGYSDLIFKGENVVFENIELKSLQMDLKGQGRISLKGDLNFLLISKFNPNLVSSSQGLKKFFTNILGQTNLAINLKGTVKNPSYDVKPVMLSDAQGFKKILEGIFK